MYILQASKPKNGFRFIFSEGENPGPSSDMSVVDSQEMATLDVTDDIVPSLQVNITRLYILLCRDSKLFLDDRAKTVFCFLLSVRG